MLIWVNSLPFSEIDCTPEQAACFSSNSLHTKTFSFKGICFTVSINQKLLCYRSCLILICFMPEKPALKHLSPDPKTLSVPSLPETLLRLCQGGVTNKLSILCSTGFSWSFEELIGNSG